MTVKVKEKPIIFSTDMVRAILDGRKTQTRRVVKPQPPESAPRTINCHWLEDGYGFFDEEGDYKCPYGSPGTILWVRETWQEGYNPDNIDKNGDVPLGYCYKASDHDISAEFSLGNWRPSIHMPKEAARLFLEVTNVRVERLQDISEEDAVWEGVEPDIHDDFSHTFPWLRDTVIRHKSLWWWCYKLGFHKLWNSINGKKHPWESNPFCWVITFRRCTDEEVSDLRQNSGNEKVI